MEAIFTEADFRPNDLNKRQLWQVVVRDRWRIAVRYNAPSYYEHDEDDDYVAEYSCQAQILLNDGEIRLFTEIAYSPNSSDLAYCLNDFLSSIKATKEEVVLTLNPIN